MPDWWLIYVLVSAVLFIPMTIVLYIILDKVIEFFRNLTGWQ
jgi:hypothetical protein